MRFFSSLWTYIWKPCDVRIINSGSLHFCNLLTSCTKGGWLGMYILFCKLIYVLIKLMCRFITCNLIIMMCINTMITNRCFNFFLCNLKKKKRVTKKCAKMRMHFVYWKISSILKKKNIFQG